MSTKKSQQYEKLAEALEDLNELKVPEHLQEIALSHLLQSGAPSGQSLDIKTTKQIAPAGETGDLREFIASKNPKSAVAEIPALLYWAQKNEGLQRADEKDVIELYRRAGMRPPKEVGQSFRDLCSKKYMRLEVAEGERGYVRLSRAGEDFVLHDLGPK